MEETKPQNIFLRIYAGKRYSRLTSLNEKARHMVMNTIFMIAVIPLSIFGIQGLSADTTRAAINFAIAIAAFGTLIAMRSNIPLKYVPIPTVIMYGSYCVFLLYNGTL